MRTWMRVIMAGALLVAPSLVWGRTADRPLDERVRHELNMLPFFSVFDYMTYRVDGDKVILAGEVTRPALKSDAETAVRRLTGVATVDDQIAVLPLSGFDDRIRLAELRTIYGNSVLQRYGMVPSAPIRIVVKNGNVTLDGRVNSPMDKNVAGVAANTVPGVFSMTNNLVVDAS